MTRRALVIRTAGDASLAGAIVDGMIVSIVTPEMDRIAARYAVSRQRDARYWERRIRRARKKYRIKPCGPLRERILRLWAGAFVRLMEATIHGKV